MTVLELNKSTPKALKVVLDEIPLKEQGRKVAEGDPLRRPAEGDPLRRPAEEDPLRRPAEGDPLRRPAEGDPLRRQMGEDPQMALDKRLEEGEDPLIVLASVDRFEKLNQVAKTIPFISRLAEHHETANRVVGMQCVRLLVERTNLAMLGQMGLPDYFFRIVCANLTWREPQLLHDSFAVFKLLLNRELESRLRYCDEVLFLLLTEMEAGPAEQRPSLIAMLAEVIELEGLAASRFLTRILQALGRQTCDWEPVKRQLRLHCWPLLKERQINL